MERLKDFYCVKVFVLFLILLRISGEKIHDDSVFDKARCSTLSCVHSSALLLQKIDFNVEPCDDFYDFACGGYISEIHTPDEKSTVDTLALMYEQLIEYLLRLFENPSEETSTKEVHKFAQNFFDSCMDTASINEVGMDPLKDLLKGIGGWPVLEESWDGKKFIGWEKTLLAFRKYVNKYDDNIFNYRRDSKDKKDKLQGIKSEELDPKQIRESLEKLISSILTGMGVLDSENVKEQVREIAEYDRAITEYQLKFKKFRDMYGKNITQIPEMKKIHKYMLYLDLLEPSVFTQVIKISDHDIGKDFNQKYVDFVKNTSNRTLANFIMWRIVQVSLSFLDKDTRNLVLTFKKTAFGNEDNEERWIYCTETITQIAPVAAGSIYIDGYFPTQDKDVADQLVDYIIRAYKDTIKGSDWMDEETKNITLEVTSRMHRFIGYHEKMRQFEGYNFYRNMPRYLDHTDFMLTGLTFKIHSTDREFKRLLDSPRRKGGLDSDWTKYARPATVNAFYSNKDNSIQFPAGILQSPNFDKDRPPFMNFGAIGSIMGHEVTHSFDDQASRIESWNKKSQEEYKERVKCIVSQYSQIRVDPVEEYIREHYNEDVEFYLNGTITKNEDIADNGGIKLAFRAWQMYQAEHEEAKIRPIGLDNITNQKMFWLSFAQTFCSVERPERMKIKVESDNHSLDKFRVNVPLMNMAEFAEAWECPLGSTMNPAKKCAVW